MSLIPLFPLSNALFPDGVVQLRIFEVRYLDMIKRCHAAGAPFGVVCLSEGSEVRRADPTSPDGFAHEAFHQIGTIARIEQIEHPQAGLMLIHCRGQQRFHITASRRLPHGLWVADVRLDEPERVVAVPEHLAQHAGRPATRAGQPARARTRIHERAAAAAALPVGRQRLGRQPLGRTAARTRRTQTTVDGAGQPDAAAGADFGSAGQARRRAVVRGSATAPACSAR